MAAEIRVDALHRAMDVMEHKADRFWVFGNDEIAFKLEEAGLRVHLVSTSDPVPVSASERVVVSKLCTELLVQVPARRPACVYVDEGLAGPHVIEWIRRTRPKLVTGPELDKLQRARVDAVRLMTT